MSSIKQHKNTVQVSSGGGDRGGRGSGGGDGVIISRHSLSLSCDSLSA